MGQEKKLARLPFCEVEFTELGPFGSLNKRASFRCRKDALHVENRRVPIAGRPVIRAAIGHVIDSDGLEAALGLGLRGIAGAINRGGERHRLAEFATIDLAAVQALDEVGDETFYSIFVVFFVFFVSLW